MATRRYGVSRGGSQETIVETLGAATTDDVEVTIDLAAGMTREDVLLLVNRLTRYVLEHDFPPASV